MKRTLLLLSLLGALLGAAAGQGGQSTPIRHGAALPVGGVFDSAFIIDDGSGSVYVCNHSPTCTTSGQWVAIAGGGGGSCSGCANQSLSNLLSTSLNQALVSGSGTPAILKGYSDAGNPAQDVDILGGTGGSSGPAGSVFISAGSNSAVGAAPGGIFISSSNNPPGSADAGNVFIGAASGCQIGAVGCSGATANGGSTYISAGAGSGAGGNAGNVVVTAGPSLTIVSGGTLHIQNFTGAISRSANVVTAITTTNTDMTWCGPGTAVNVAAVDDSSFDGSFTLTSCVPGLASTLKWNQSGTNASSKRGVVTGTGSVSNNSVGDLLLEGGGALQQNNTAAATGGIGLFSGTLAVPGEIDFETFGTAGLFEIFSGSFSWKTDGSGDIGTASHRPNNILVKNNVTAGGFVSTAAVPWITSLHSASVTQISMSTSSNVATIYGVTLSMGLTSTKICYDVGNADNSSGHSYDIGLYAGTPSGTPAKIVDAAAAGTSFSPATGWTCLNWAQGATVLVPGRYYLAITSSCIAGGASCAELAGDSAGVMFENGTVAVSTGGTLPGTITSPADTITIGNLPAVIIE